MYKKLSFGKKLSKMYFHKKKRHKVLHRQIKKKKRILSIV